jgi:pimeloyl-ACP methyl ester carboxylesterase/HEAT repeat protein
MLGTELSALNQAELVALLGRFGAKAVPLLVQASKDRLLEVDGAQAIASIDEPAVITQPMAGFLGSANPKVRLFALKWFQEQGRSLPDEERRLVALLGDPSSEVRDLAGTMVADRCPARCLSGALAIYRNESTRASASNLVLRLGLLKTMGFIGAREPRLGAILPPVLIQAIYIKDQQQASIDALVAIGQPAVPALLMLLKHGDVARAPAAMEALMKLGPAAAPEVVSLLGARHEKLRELALRFLSFYRDPQVLPALVKFYEGGNTEAKIGALRVAALYQDPTARELLVKALLTGDERLKLEAVDAMVNSGAKELVPHLLKAAEEESEIMVRVRAVEALFKLGERSAVPSFLQMLQYDRWEIRLAVLQAMAWMGGTEHIPMVAAQLSHRRPDVVTAATKALRAMSYSETDRSVEDWQELAASIGRRKPLPPSMLKELTLPTGKETVVIAGDADGDRKLLLLVPGDPLRAGWLQTFIGPLAGKSQIVVMGFDGCDQAKSGASQPLASCLGRAAARIAAVRENLGLKQVYLVGHSTAAYAAIWYASESTAGVRGLVIMDAPWPDPAILNKAASATEGRLSNYWKGQLRQLEADRSLMTQQVFLMYRSRAELAALASDARQALDVGEFFPPWGLLAQTDLQDSFPELERRVSSINLPTLLIVGQQDVARDETLARFRALGKVKKNLAFASVAEAVHFPMLTSKGEAARGAITAFMGLVEERGPGAAERSGALIVYGDSQLGAAALPADQGPALPTVVMAGSPLNQIWTDSPGANRRELADSLKQLSAAEDTGLEGGQRAPLAEPAPAPKPMVARQPKAEQPKAEQPVVAAQEEKPQAEQAAARDEEADDEPRTAANDQEADDEPRTAANDQEADDEPRAAANDEEADDEPRTAAREADDEPRTAAREEDDDRPPVAAREEEPKPQPKVSPKPVARPAAKTAQTRPGTTNGGAVSKSFEAPGANPWPWVLMGSGVLAAAGGVYLNLVALDDAKKADGLAPTLPDYSKRFDSLYDGAANKAYAAYGLYGAGALLVGGGIAWLLLDGDLPFFGLTLPTRRGEDTWGVNASCSF